MFANQLNVISDSNFLTYVNEAEMLSYDLHFNKAVIKGRLGVDKQFLIDNKTILRVCFNQIQPSNGQILNPQQFVYANLEGVIDEINFSQRIILEPEFMVEIPHSITDFENVTVFFSFVTSGEPTSQINYYSKIISLIASSILISSSEVSDKTYPSVFLDDRFLLNPPDYSAYENEIYTSQLFHTLDQQNNFYATFFYNVENYLREKIWLKNLFVFPKFYDYFLSNYLISVSAVLKKDSFTLPLQVVPQKNVSVTSQIKNDSLLMRADGIDAEKYNNGTVDVRIKYNESSIDYVQNIIIPFIDETKKNLKVGLISSAAFDLLMYYKLIKELRSKEDSLSALLNLQNLNTEMPINQNNVDRLLEIAFYVKNKLINSIYDVNAENRFNREVVINLEQPVDLNYKNAKINFILGNSLSGDFPTYSVTNFSSSFSQECSRFFPEGNFLVNNVPVFINELPISYSPNNITLDQTEILQNNVNFNSYVENTINEQEKRNYAYQFAKICSYFNLNREAYKVQQDGFGGLLKSNLFYNNLEVFEINEQTPRQKAFASIKMDDPRSYNTFPENYSNDACIDAATVVLPTNLETTAIERRTPENLANNLTVNRTFIESNTYSENYTNLTPTNALPVQVLYPLSQFVERTNKLFEAPEPVINDAKLFGIFYLNFKVLGQVEYMQELTKGMFSIWQPLTLNSLSNLQTGQRVFCRLNFYNDSAIKITEQTFDAFSIYNKYFYLEA